MCADDCHMRMKKGTTCRHAVKDSVHVDRLDRLRADGNAAFKAGNLQTAKKLYTAAISLAESMPDEPVAKLQPTRRAQLLANRCQVSLALERVVDALSDAQAACSSAPGWPKAHYRLGTVLLSRKEYLKAYGAFKQAWHLDVKNPELTKACQDAYELLSGRDRESTAKGAQLRSQVPPAAGTVSVASAAIHTAAAEQAVKAARGAEASGADDGKALNATEPSAATPPAAAPPAAASGGGDAEHLVEVEPVHTLTEAEEGCLELRIELRGLSSMAEVELDVSRDSISLLATSARHKTQATPPEATACPPPSAAAPVATPEPLLLPHPGAAALPTEPRVVAAR